MQAAKINEIVSLLSGMIVDEVKSYAAEYESPARMEDASDTYMRMRLEHIQELRAIRRRIENLAGNIGTAPHDLGAL
jgi:hypothetical protein